MQNKSKRHSGQPRSVSDDAEHIVLLAVAIMFLMHSKAILEEHNVAFEANQKFDLDAEAAPAPSPRQETQIDYEVRRSVCTQNKCTYSRKNTQPRFTVLGERETEPFFTEACIG